MGLLTNGWNNVVDNNSGKTLGGQVIFKPTGALSIVQNYMAGPEQPDDSDDWRQISDTTVTFTATKALTLMGNYDYGHDTFAGVGGHWQGFAGYAKFQANESVAIIPRFEWYNDEAGFTTGTPQTLKEATITLEAKALDNLLWRHRVPRRLLRSGRLQERRWRLQGSAALHRHRHAVFIQLQGEIARTGLASVRYSPMATLRPKPSPAVLLDAARRELGDEIVRGEGGRVALERYSGRLDALIGQLVVDCATPRSTGRDRRAGRLRPPPSVPLLGHRSADRCSTARWATAMSDSCAACCIRSGTPVWSSATRSGRSTSFAQLEVDNPEFLLALVDARPIARRPGAVRSASGRRFTPRRRTRSSSARSRQLIDERHAQFNDTLYQLEPDVKDAPGALRDLTATRTHRLVDRSGAARAGAGGSRAASTTRKIFCLRVRSMLHLEAAQPECADPRVAGAGRGAPRLPGSAAAAARRTADGGLLPSCPRGRARAGVGAANRADAGRRERRSLDRRDQVHRSRQGRASSPATWLSAFQAALDGECEVANDALVCMRQHAERFDAADFFPTPPIARRCFAS